MKYPTSFFKEILFWSTEWAKYPKAAHFLFRCPSSRPFGSLALLGDVAILIECGQDMGSRSEEDEALSSIFSLPLAKYLFNFKKISKESFNYTYKRLKPTIKRLSGF